MKNTSKNRCYYSIVVPAYNSTHSLVELVARVQTIFEEVISESYEIIFVDDGSLEKETWNTIKELCNKYSNITGVKLGRNYGKANAVICGIGMSRGERVVTIDDDLQQRPEDIPELAKYKSHDIVVANYKKKKHSLTTIITSTIKSYFDKKILGLPCKMSPLKIFKKEVAENMLTIKTARPFIPALMSYVTTDIYPVVVEHDKSYHGKSRYNIVKRLKQFSNLLIGNSSFLLRFVGSVGLMLALSGFAFVVYIVIRKLIGSIGEPGWASLIAINLIFGGMILIALGIIGEYLVRLLEGSYQKPPYIIKERVVSKETLQNK